MRKSSRIIEQEKEITSAKQSKTFRDTIKFDATLYQSADEDDDSDNAAAENNDENEDTANIKSSQKNKKKKSSNDKKKEIVPKVNKNQALLEEIKMREEQEAGMESKMRQRLLNISVDPNCEVQNVHVLKDYSCHLQQSDIAYDQNEHTRFFKMQLLERNDKKKWSLWVQNGRVGVEQNAATKVSEFFNNYDAMVEFEKKFQEKTGNKWKKREFFEQKPGKYILFNREQEKELTKKY